MRSIRKLAIAAVTAAFYAALTLLAAPISFNSLQFRISEVLCILPYFMPCTAWGLAVGCVISNLFSMAGLLDVIFGPLATLLAAGCTAWFGRRKPTVVNQIAACAMPVLFNGVIVGGVLAKALAGLYAWPLFGLQVAIGELGVLFLFGLPLMRTLPKLRVFTELIERVNGRPFVYRLPDDEHRVDKRQEM